MSASQSTCVSHPQFRTTQLCAWQTSYLHFLVGLGRAPPARPLVLLNAPRVGMGTSIK